MATRPHATLSKGYVLNDPTLEILVKVAVPLPGCGADIVASSGMLNGMAAAIRGAGWRRF